MPDPTPIPKRKRGRPPGTTRGRYQPDREWIARVREGLDLAGVTLREVARATRRGVGRYRSILAGRIQGDLFERNSLERFANQESLRQ